MPGVDFRHIDVRRVLLHAEAFEEFFRGIVPHLLETVVDGCHFDDDGEVPAGVDRDGIHGDAEAEDLHRLIGDAHAFIGFRVVPGFQVDDEVDAFSHLDRSHTEDAPGVEYISTVETLLAQCGIGNVLATPKSTTLSTGRVWTGDTNALEIANSLLEEINYKQLWFNADGTAVLEPYAEPTAADIKHTLDGDNFRSLLLPKISKKTDIFIAPNTVYCFCSSPDQSSILWAGATNNSPSSPYSVIRRGRRIVKTVQVKNIASQSELQAYADRLRNESMLRGETVQVETGLLPGYGVADVVGLHYGDLSALCLDKAWSMDFQPGGTMTHTLERVVANIG